MYLNAKNQRISGSGTGGGVVGVLQYQASERGSNPSVVICFFSFIFS